MSQDVKLAITADASKAIAEIKRVDGALTATAGAGEAAAKRIGGGFKSVDEAAGRAGNAAKKLRGALGAISPELANLAGSVDDAADAIEAMGIATGGAASAGLLLNPVVLAGVAAFALIGYAIYTSVEANKAHEAAVRANHAAIEAAGLAAEKARAAIGGLTIDWQAATGQVTKANAEFLKGAAGIDGTFDEAVTKAKENVQSLTWQLDALKQKVTDSGGFATYREQIATISAQLYIAEQAHADLGVSIDQAKEKAGDIALANEEERRATEAARKAADAKSEAERRAAEAARRHAAAAAELKTALEAAARVAEQYAAGLVALADTGRLASEANLQGIAREESARAHALESLQAQYEATAAASQGNFDRLAAAESAHALSKEQIIAASDERIAALRLKAAADAQARLDAGVAATVKAESDKAAAVVGTLNQAFGVASQLFDLGVGYQVDVLRAMEADLATNEENMTAGQKKELKKRIAAQRDAALQAFNIAKAAKVAEAIASTALAVINAISQSPPPSPFGVIGAGIAAAAGAVSIAQIASQEPSFHVGTSQVQRAAMPDEVRATLLEGEAVLSRRAVADSGGRVAIEERNAGRRSGSQGAPRPAPIQYRHREFNEFIRDNIRLGGPLATAINDGERVGHRKRGSA